MNTNRDINLDLLRFLGVLIIMVAHARPPGWLYQLRNFGTPLLIVASALTYSVIYSNREMMTSAFIKKRLSRLVLPAWVFLVFGFCVTYIVAALTQTAYPFSRNEIIESFTFYDGIGFVWIFKVYIILALLTPLALKLSQSSASNQTYFSVLAAVYILYELIVASLTEIISPQLTEFFNSVVFVIAPYSVLYFYGMRLPSLSTKQVTGVIFISLMIFLMLMILKFISLGEFVPTQEFKYPPRLYYLSYAFFALNLVYLICRNLSITNQAVRNVVVWLSSHSLWIYLWHIMGFFIWRFLIEDFLNRGMITFVLNAAFLLLFGVAMTYLQMRLLVPLKERNEYWQRKIISVLT